MKRRMAQASNNPTQRGGIQIQKPALPKGGGAIQGMGETFAVDEFNGTSSLAIPIPATPCRGFEPTIRLDYSSGSGNSPFGLGWQLSLPEISRQTSLGIPKYDDSDTFLLTGNDYLVPKLNATEQPVVTTRTLGPNTYSVAQYIPRTEGDFDLIERYTREGEPSDVFWRVTSKDNIVSIYGKSAQAKIYDPADNTRIFKWLLEESYDAKGDHAVYLYCKENADNIPVSASEKNRDKQTNSYLTQINYGNDQPITDGSLVAGESHETTSNVLWHFAIVFDYGEYDTSPSNTTACDIPDGKTWLSRQDPFSNYSAGFEIRTYRLCRNILLFHYFQEISASGPALNSVLRLNYNESPLLTLLNGVQHIGYQYIQAAEGKAAHYRTKSLPWLEFGYTPFSPAQETYTFRDYERFTNTEQELPQVSSAPHFQLIDLYGEGIPGILYADGETIRYRSALSVSTGAVRYGREINIPFPNARRVEDATHTLTDVTGNGRLGLVVSTPGHAGYYEMKGDAGWQPFSPFESFPTNFHYPLNNHVDLTGDGLADLLLIEDEVVRIHPCQGKDGYGKPVLRARENGLPISKADTPVQIIRFIDMVGSGQAQLVRISNGSVECWPSLGYGKFGQPIVMDNAPNFGDDFDTARLLLTDINGSGTTDLAYISPEHVDIYLNQSGNSFATTPIRIPLPAPWDSLNQIQFADVMGNGTSCLVFTQTHPQPKQWFYDFNRPSNGQSDTQATSQKPYLLNEVNNNMGARTEITYAPSTKFYLQDKANGLPWITSLPFPVNIIETITHYDDIAQTSVVSSYCYHHGYYDGDEREFRGFGRVDRTDAPSFAGFTAEGTAQAAAYCPPPALTKTWYHTGAYLDEEDLLAQYEKEYWNGDKAAYAMPPTMFEYLDANADAKTLRGARRALHGMVIRSEVYGNDDSSWQDTPYTVSQSQFKVIELQKTASNQYPVFLLHNRENIAYDYERNANDPRINHSFTLEIDAYGQVLQACSVGYGRRTTQVPATMDSRTAEKQRKTWVSYQENVYINSPDMPSPPDFYQLGVAQESKSYEIKGLNPDVGDYFSFEGIAQQINAALQPTATSAKLLHWERNYYYDADNEKELPLGQVTAQQLHHRTEFIAFQKDMAIPGLPPGKRLRELLIGDGTQFHGAKGGYVTFDSGDAEKYYWNPGGSQTYDAAHFYLPNAYFDPFQYQQIKNGTPGVPTTERRTRYVYDPYDLTLRSVVDPLGNQIIVTRIDYRTLHASDIQDANGNTVSAVFDPLGMVIATSTSGTQAGETVGFSDLSSYEPVANPSLDAIMNATDPDIYLQGAATFFYYDLDSWVKRQIPAHTVELRYDDYTCINGARTAPLPGIQKSVTYSDGFGRILQSKAFSDSTQTVRFWNTANQTVATQTANPCWLTSGAVRYDSKGQPIKEYEPFFSLDYRYVGELALSEIGHADTLFHDSLGREVLQLSPEGFITKTLFGTFGGASNPGAYNGYLNQKLYMTLPWEFIPTPWTSLSFDANDALLDSDYAPSARSDVDTDALNKAKMFANTPFEHIEDSLGRTVQSLQLDVPENEQDNTFATFDILGNELRLHGLFADNFVTTYNLAQAAIQVISADAGTKWALADVLGQPIYQKDSRNFELFHSYDALHRPVQTYVQGGDGAQPLAQTVKLTVYGDSLDNTGKPYFNTPERLNLRGKAVISLDEAGLALSPSFTLHDQSLLHARWLKSDYRNEADWNTVVEGALETLADTMAGKYQPADYRSLALTAPLGNLLISEVFVTSATHDALGRLRSSTDTDGNEQQFAYYCTNWLKSLNSSLGSLAQAAEDESSPDTSYAPPGIAAISYNAHGLTTALYYANGITTHHHYNLYNHRLTNIKSTRLNSTKTSLVTLQDLHYNHDPVGNITTVTNNAIPSVFFNNQQVDAKAGYTFDSLYRLIIATGREHASLWSNVQANQNKLDAAFLNALGPQLTNGQALRTYIQQFSYDGAGNLTQMRQSGSVANRIITIQGGNNRIAISSTNTATTKYGYDDNGNMSTLDGTAGVSWNYRDNMASATIIDRDDGNNDTEYYVYDGAGQRVRKVTERVSRGFIAISEVLYVGGIEIRRSGAKNNDGAINYTKEWHHVRLTEGAGCFCVCRYLVNGNAKIGVNAYQLRYQLNDILNSSCMEVDALASIISHQEYYPYGGTSIIAAESQIEVKYKHCRYSGKEQDATGLYYYGMRYYAPWLGRWTSTDPAGTIDGLNLYAFVGGNPVTHVDVGGMATPSKKKMAGKKKAAKPKPAAKATKAAKKNKAAKKAAKKPAKKKGKPFYGSLLSMRCRANPDGTPTQAPAIPGNYKTGTKRLRWKGAEDKAGFTGGIAPQLTTRDSQGWAADHEARRTFLAAHFAGKMTPLHNGVLSENSHLVAGSFYGPNDEHSAPAASVHQNTEWLAIEEGIKRLIKGSQNPIIKVTGYVHDSGPLAHTLKAARYKIYLGGNKVFDHVAMGDRGNIDMAEASALKSKVAALTSTSPAISGKYALSTHVLPVVATAHGTSKTNPMFTGIS